MTNPAFLTDEEAQQLSRAHATLEEHGVLTPDADYDVASLATAVYARRWAYSIDRSGPDFRATVTTSDGLHRGAPTVGVGWTVETALAIAFAKALGTPSR